MSRVHLVMVDTGRSIYHRAGQRDPEHQGDVMILEPGVHLATIEKVQR